MTIKIEKGIPVQRASVKRNTGLCAAMRAMEVGDSFVYPLHLRTSITATQCQTEALKARTFVTRKISATDLRTWRTA